jgi:5-methylcytosine-specific restriction endonuclease McrA
MFIQKLPFSSIEMKKEDYDILLNDARWHLKRRQILKRDEFKCRNCYTKNKLQVHHKVYFMNSQTKMFVSPWNYKERYLVTLCATCHKSGHKLYKVKTYTI